MVRIDRAEYHGILNQTKYKQFWDTFGKWGHGKLSKMTNRKCRQIERRTPTTKPTKRR